MTLSAICSMSQPCVSASRRRASFACANAKGEPRAPRVEQNEDKVIQDGLSFEEVSCQAKPMFEKSALRESLNRSTTSRYGMAEAALDILLPPVDVGATQRHQSPGRKSSILAFIAALAAGSAFAAEDGYPPGPIRAFARRSWTRCLPILPDHRTQPVRLTGTGRWTTIAPASRRRPSTVLGK